MPDTVRGVGLGVMTLSAAQADTARRLLDSVRSGAGLGSLPSTANLLGRTMVTWVDALSLAPRAECPVEPAQGYVIVDRALTRC